MEPQENTTTVTTPSGEHEVVFKAYLTGLDKRETRRKISALTGGSLDQADVEKEIDGAEDALVQQVVVSIDGSSENIIERFLKLRAVDYDFVLATVNTITQGLDDKKKVISDGSTETISTEQK